MPLLRVLLFLLVLLAAQPGALAQTPAAPTPEPTPAASALALAEIAAQAESAELRIRAIEQRLNEDQRMKTIEEGLQAMSTDITARAAEGAKTIENDPTTETLRALTLSWQEIVRTLQGWERMLTERAVEIDTQLVDLAEMSELWQQTKTAAADSSAPEEILQRIKTTQKHIRTTTKLAERQRRNTLALQANVIEEGGRVKEALAALEKAEEEVVSQIFVRQSRPLWSEKLRDVHTEPLAVRGQLTFSGQREKLERYCMRHPDRFLLHGIFFFMLLAALFRGRGAVEPSVEGNGTSARALLIVRRPISTALIVSAVVGVWIHSDAPRLFWSVNGVAALIPAFLILRGLLDRALIPLLPSLALLYLLDQVRALSSALPFFSRSLFVGEMVLGALLVIWMLRSSKVTEATKVDALVSPGVLRAIARVLLFLFAAAAAAAVLGYVSLGYLLGNSALRATYAGLCLYAVASIILALLSLSGRSALFRRSLLLKNYGMTLRRQVSRIIQWAALLLWAAFILEELSLRRRFITQIKEILNAELTFGAIGISLGKILACALTVWVTFLLSRIFRAILEQEVYPRLRLGRGLPYAISMVLHYLVLLFGFFLAIGALGFDLTKFTILAGAFGVGLGFGLQNIVNNFFSGLILLFERPIRVGDIVQVGDLEGVVQRIGIRASIIRTTRGSEIIMPNAKLISDQVTNWTLSTRERIIELPVSVTNTADPDKVLALLKQAAHDTPDICAVPEPQAVLVKWAPNSLLFELRVWTTRFEEWAEVRSALAVKVNAYCRAEDVVING